eukprot:gnl/TRDRNA2_/TRDRNA2_66875_c0_seq1.p1 gnl/TRDRNA2_/TRDRNA2_66875_c0~~gnl/TRDRNA2_/TRDRNA2_66875_c0_seq1.p1  ORF type:complete len:127 (-),score=7.69 gnl/TRDRNA2_/TRDRNA2_66875_c0_seq1:218-598(-)
MCNALLDVLKHFVHARDVWPCITRWVIRIRCHIDALDDSVVDEHRKTLASLISQGSHRTRMIKNCTYRLCEHTLWIAEKCNHASFNLLILGPSRHDSTVVYAVNNDICDALGLQLTLLCQVAWDLA